MNPEYKQATVQNVDLLTQLRIQVLRAANNLPHSIDMASVAASTKKYYLRHLPQGSHIAYLVYDGSIVVGTGGVSFYQVMPTFHNPSGWKAYIMNMYTLPAYRRKGIARKTLDLLVAASKTRKISFISLEATEMGKPLYEKYGFLKIESEMILP